MTWEELREIRGVLGLSGVEMAKLLRVSESTYKGWKTRGKVPNYIASSAEARLELFKMEVKYENCFNLLRNGRNA
jgi:DNA-binding transcriptional regulator YiaG